MFDFLQPRKNVAPGDSRSPEAIANNVTKALDDDGAEAEKNQKAQTPRNDTAASLPTGEAKHPKTPHPESTIHREAVAALNVKVVCELADLLPDKAKYEVTREEAIGLALSIENGSCRYFALDHVVGLCRKRGDLHVAKQLLDQVADNALREHILKLCPELRHPGLVKPHHT